MNHEPQSSPDAGTSPFEVLALAASAGGQNAVITLLRGLPAGFSVPIILMQHLGPESQAVDFYARRIPAEVEWVGPQSALAPGKLLVCPPRSFVELLPDGSCTVSPCERGALAKPIDRFLDSIARSFGERTIGVILTGMGSDGAAGAQRLRLAGGRVLVQTEASAEHPDMPRAVIKAGAADLIVPLQDLGQVIGEIVAGTPRPRARSEVEAIARVFGERGEVAARAREMDWSRTPLGSVLGWPADLRLMVRTVLDAPYMTAVWCGPQLVQVYNDAWLQFLGVSKHPQALGGRARDTWPEIWHLVGPTVEQVMTRGEAVGGETFLLLIDRPGIREEVFVTFAYSPIRDAAGAVMGVHNTGWDVTKNVVAERRMRALRDLAARTAGAATPRAVCELAAAALGADSADLPFALIYLMDEVRGQATLAGAAGIDAGSPAAPHWIDLAAADYKGQWPLSRALAAGVLLEDLAERFADRVPPPGPRPGLLPPRAAMLLPLRPVADKRAVGILVAGLSPHRPLDEEYRSFLDLVVQQIDAGLIEARAKQLERERHERLAELDRAKTEFFANVSHEFRTPLTLLLAPLDDLLRRRDELPESIGRDIDVAARNARRLLGLVNNLLDFSQIEARQKRARLQAVDLGAVTTDIASAFRSAIEAAGLRFRVECDPKMPPVPVNQEMWEKIVSNLLSNALKFTFAGEIAVELRALSLHAELVVRDSGVGIPEHELPNIFKRFHRVRGARARTVEGSGIGLAIVQDLVARMGGQLRVRSAEGRGTTFTIWMPYKAARDLGAPSPASSSGDDAAVRTGTGVAADLAVQASRWLADSSGESAGVADDLWGPPPSQPVTRLASKKGRVLVVDDNADLRDYLRRLLSSRWDVDVAADGGAGLELTRRLRPDVVLADVTMPGLDGFELLKQIREDPELRHTPVVLVTARAAEEAAIEGLVAGADDYVAKPFSPRELVARVQAVIDRTRADAVLRERAAWLRGQRAALEAAMNDEPLEASLGALVSTATGGLGEGMRAAFYLANKDGTSLHHVVGMGAAYADAVDGLELGPESLACGLATHTGQPVLTTDVMEEERWEPWRRLAERFDYRGCWCFPIHTSAGTFVGTFALYSRNPRGATEHDLELASLLVHTASIIISRHKESEARQRAEQALQRAKKGRRPS